MKSTVHYVTGVRQIGNLVRVEVTAYVSAPSLDFAKGASVETEKIRTDLAWGSRLIPVRPEGYGDIYADVVTDLKRELLVVGAL